MNPKTLAKEFESIYRETDSSALGPITIEPDLGRGVTKLISPKTGRSVTLRYDRLEMATPHSAKTEEAAAIDRAYNFKKVESGYLDEFEKLWPQFGETLVNSAEHQRLRKRIIEVLADHCIVKTFHEIISGG